jgi:hypothetical protein
MKSLPEFLLTSRRHALALLLAGVALSSALPAHAQTAISNLGQGVSAGVGVIGRVGGGENHRYAFSFTTGSSTATFDFTSVTMAFQAGQGSPTLAVGLYSSFAPATVAGGGTLLTNLSLSSGNPLAAGNAVFSGTATLAASTQYFLVFDAGTQSAGNVATFSTPSTYLEDSGGLPGWSIGDSAYHSFPSQSGTWSSTGTVAMFSVQASEVSVIPEPSTYAAMFGAAALGLAVWQRRRQRANAEAAG